MKCGVIVVSVLAIFFAVVSCRKFEANPYSGEALSDLPENLNHKNANRLGSGNIGDTVKVMFIGDTQRFYDALGAAVDLTNRTTEVDFLVMAGDITDFGLGREFKWVYERLKDLKVPYFCVIGNHDLVTNGGEHYEKIFGDKNFSFTFAGYKFIFHDTNGREYGFNGSVPDLDYLRSQMGDQDPEWLVGMSHVPPFNEDFDPTLEEPYSRLFASDQRFIASLHGHLHGTIVENIYDDQVKYIVAPAVSKNFAYLLRFYDGKIKVNEFHY
jgi:3',5'-cyclic-AMP phosphodiesterase